MEVNELNLVSTVTAPIALNRWLAVAGVSNVTAWRWRKNGWLQTVNICGRVYVTPQGIADFMERATRGEFARKHTVPPPPFLIPEG